ncbi:Peptidase T [Sphingobacterium daejeonense]|nr:Peptidase T [Sphingobacterium daejeonense]
MFRLILNQMFSLRVFLRTEKQKDLSRILVEELKAIGITDAHLDDLGYVYATIPSNN